MKKYEIQRVAYYIRREREMKCNSRKLFKFLQRNLDKSHRAKASVFIINTEKESYSSSTEKN